MDIKRDRMVFLGYGKYWRSDRILGLMPIEEGRGPGQRTNVFVEGRADPIVASRTEESILEDMGASDDSFQDRKSTRLNSSHGYISYAVFCLKKKKRLKICSNVSADQLSKRNQ